MIIIQLDKKNCCACGTRVLNTCW